MSGGISYRQYERTADYIISGGLTTVSGFALDKYLVTVGRYRQFVAAWNGEGGAAPYRPVAGSGKHTHLNGGRGLAVLGSDGAPAGAELGWQDSYSAYVDPQADQSGCSHYAGREGTFTTWTATPAGRETLPINCVNWYEAYAFCIWDGGYLPTTAEWFYASTGGDQQRPYPWGSTAPGTSNQYAIYGCYYNGSGDNTCTGATNIAPVGSATAGAGRWGHLDLFGNLLAWHMGGTGNSVCNDCVVLSEPFREVGKGHFDWPTLDPFGLGEGMTSQLLTHSSMSTGMRCARSGPP
jgi:formylglycine-generating enzyme required for sulfatase activity